MNEVMPCLGPSSRVVIKWGQQRAFSGSGTAVFEAIRETIDQMLMNNKGCCFVSLTNNDSDNLSVVAARDLVSK